MLQDFFCAISITLSTFALGYLLSLFFIPGLRDGLLRIGVAYPLGAGIFTFWSFILGWVGMPISRSFIIISFLALLILILLIHLIRRTQFPSLQIVKANSVHEIQNTRILNGALWLGLIIIWVFSVISSIGVSYSGFDAAAEWAVEGYGIALEGSVRAGEEWGMWGLSYPLNIKLQVANFSLFDCELLPGSKILFPMYLISVGLVIYDFWRKHEVTAIVATLGVLFIASNPRVFDQSISGYVNMAFTTALVCGILLIIEGYETEEEIRQLLGGLLLGIAAWTRPEGLGFSLFIAIFLISVGYITERKAICPLCIILPIVVSSFWLVFAWQDIDQGQLGNALKTTIQGWSGGDLNLFELYLIPRIFIQRAIKPFNWGAFVPVVFGLILLAFFFRSAWKLPSNILLATIAILLCLIPLGIYYTVSYDPFDVNLRAILSRDFDRAFMPAFMVLTVYAVNLWASPRTGGSIDSSADVEEVLEN